ncbi:ATP-grasp fold amidoligase family protein [Pseudoalteromonas sp. AS84]|uniref:ATP-grasp fold amidoligase family protein n=1 Tax=Pseudoalteromonas sp. AS84 TaxID=3135778 RepID=UPI0031822195
MKFSKVILIIVRNFDYYLFVKTMNFEQYFNFHKKMNFPLIRLSFYNENRYWPDFKNPKTFNEKLIADKLFNRKDITPIITDKYTVRSYVASKIGERYLIPLIAAFETVEEYLNCKLPKNYILKMSHSSGQNVIVKDGKINRSKVIKNIKCWISEKYRYQPLVWFTQLHKRRILIEELLIDESGKVPKDYKLFVFKGVVVFIQVDLDRFEGHTRTLYSPSWELLDVKYKYTKGYDVEAPKNLNEMIELAKVLGSDFEFMRVDLYEVGDKIYFGELTPYPSAGYALFTPSSYDTFLGGKL